MKLCTLNSSSKKLENRRVMIENMKLLNRIENKKGSIDVKKLQQNSVAQEKFAALRSTSQSKVLPSSSSNNKLRSNRLQFQCTYNDSKYLIDEPDKRFALGKCEKDGKELELIEYKGELLVQILVNDLGDINEFNLGEIGNGYILNSALDEYYSSKNIDDLLPHIIITDELIEFSKDTPKESYDDKFLNFPLM